MKSSSDRASERVFLWVIGVGIVLAGIAFGAKIAGFVHALTSPDFRGTFDVGITVYFVVSAGWLCLLIWCLTNGKFAEMERSKYDMLRKEEEYDRLGI